MRNATDMIDRVITLWNAGSTAGEIAATLHISRNRVMGLLYRARTKGLAVKRRNRSPGERDKQAFKRLPARRIGRFRSLAVIRPWMVKPQARPSASLPVIHLALPSGRIVRWHVPEGCAFMCNDDAADPDWCNAPVVAPGYQWCPYHFRLTHMPAKRGAS